MAATTGPIGERLRSFRVLEGIPLAANTKINQGADLAVNASGQLVPVTSSAAIKPLGAIAPRTFDNTGGAAGAVLGAADFIRERRVRGYLNDAAPNAVSRANVGSTVFHLDDQTLTTLGTGRSATNGKVLDVTDASSDVGAFVWVEI
ncbi:hypothetical protein WME76_02250 [Sorangium sp. So ce119]|uniref:hypothetical protein n=1 Tax=Sorangium sp. So ce119 TaxID=3133279 RepID=UPI003F5FD784